VARRRQRPAVPEPHQLERAVERLAARAGLHRARRQIRSRRLGTRTCRVRDVAEPALQAGEHLTADAAGGEAGGEREHHPDERHEGDVLGRRLAASVAHRRSIRRERGVSGSCAWTGTDAAQPRA
jgi:hypothetical protein